MKVLLKDSILLRYVQDRNNNHFNNLYPPDELKNEIFESFSEFYFEIEKITSAKLRIRHLSDLYFVLDYFKIHSSDQRYLGLLEGLSFAFWYSQYAPIQDDMVADLFEADIKLINKYLNSKVKDFYSMPESDDHYKAHEQRLEELMEKDPVLKEMVLNRRMDPMGY
jgi:hypothetical protein